jgi:hypothetical protein
MQANVAADADADALQGNSRKPPCSAAVITNDL